MSMFYFSFKLHRTCTYEKTRYLSSTSYLWRRKCKQRYV